MKEINISLIVINNIHESARVLSVVMPDNSLHYAVLRVSEIERLEIEKCS